MTKCETVGIEDLRRCITFHLIPYPKDIVKHSTDKRLTIKQETRWEQETPGSLT
jgi:chromatin remodeling complex protein RSC6